MPLTAEQILCKSILTDCSQALKAAAHKASLNSLSLNSDQRNPMAQGPDAQFTLSSLRKKFKNRRQQAFRNNLGEKLLS